MKKKFYNPSAHIPAYGYTGSHSQNALPIHGSKALKDLEANTDNQFVYCDFLNAGSWDRTDAGALFLNEGAKVGISLNEGVTIYMADNHSIVGSSALILINGTADRKVRFTRKPGDVQFPNE